MERKGFKWKTLQNLDNGTRFQIMQYNRPKELIVEDFNKARNMKLRQEPLCIKAALLMRIFKDLYSDASPYRDTNKKVIEVPYTKMASLLKYRTDKGIDLK